MTNPDATKFLRLAAGDLAYDDQTDLAMPPWEDVLDLEEQRLQEVATTSTVDLNDGLFGVPNWEDWTS